MRRLLFLFLVILLAVSCQREDELPEATSAAMEVYRQYADRKELTVALIGDYKGYNAVMLQADNPEEWLRLCTEFGVTKHVDASALDSTRVSSLTTVSHTGGVIRNVDSIFDVSDALLQTIIDSVMTDILRSGNMSGPVVVDTIYSFTHRESYDHGALVDSATSTDTVSHFLDNDLLQNALRHGECGYIIHDDSDALTLWLFFYSTEAEKEQILNHITSTIGHQ